MKKSLCGFVAVSIITLVMPVHAQKSYVGVLGGMNLADLKIVFEDQTLTDHDVQSRTLFGVGGFFGISVNDHLSVQLEPMYMSKGGVYTKPSIPDMNIKSSQLDVLLLLKGEIGDQVRPYILAGPFVSFVLEASLETEMAGRAFEGNLLEILKRTEFGVLFGAGISIPVWKGSAFIEGRFALGLTNLNKGGSFDLSDGSAVVPGPTTVPGDVIKTTSIQIMVGYQLPLGGQ
jgi:hypothetical protein